MKIKWMPMTKILFESINAHFYNSSKIMCVYSLFRILVSCSWCGPKITLKPHIYTCTMLDAIAFAFDLNNSTTTTEKKYFYLSILVNLNVDTIYSFDFFSVFSFFIQRISYFWMKNDWNGNLKQYTISVALIITKHTIVDYSKFNTSRTEYTLDQYEWDTIIQS